MQSNDFLNLNILAPISPLSPLLEPTYATLQSLHRNKSFFVYCSFTSVLQEILRIKISHHYHTQMKVIFADNQQKFDSRSNMSLHIQND